MRTRCFTVPHVLDDPVAYRASHARISFPELLLHRLLLGLVPSCAEFPTMAYLALLVAVASCLLIRFSPLSLPWLSMGFLRMKWSS